MRSVSTRLVISSIKTVDKHTSVLLRNKCKSTTTRRVDSMIKASRGAICYNPASFIYSWRFSSRSWFLVFSRNIRAPRSVVPREIRGLLLINKRAPRWGSLPRRADGRTCRSEALRYLTKSRRLTRPGSCWTRS